MRLGIVTGLACEATCLRVLPAAARPAVRCAGAMPGRAGLIARALVSEGCGALLSFGMAGGLAPGLGAGSVVVADRILAPGGKRFPTDPDWREGLCNSLAEEMDVSQGSIAGSPEAVATPAGKQALHASTGAVAVDMESHAVAAAADDKAVPFLAVRVIADPDSRTIPAWILGCVGEDGAVSPIKVVGGLMFRPWDAVALLKLSSDAGDALINLRRVATLAGPRFGLGTAPIQ